MAAPCDTRPVSDDLDVRDDARARWARRDRLTLPAALATGIGIPLFALSVLLEVVATVAIHHHAGIHHHPGVIDLPPSRAERLRTDARRLTPLVVGLLLLALTWRFRGQGRATATWVCAVGVVLMGIACW